MKSKLLILLFIIVILLTSCTTKQKEEERFNEHGVLFDVDEIDNELKDKYYYHQLTDDEKLYYQALYYASKNYTSTIEWTFFPDSQILKRARRAFIEDNPLYYWINYQSFIYTEKIVVNKDNGEEFIYYKSTPENSDETNIKECVKKLEDIGEKVVKDCYDDDPYQYVKNIHDYVCENIVYTADTGNQQTLYGALLEGKCVCEGYSRAFQYLTNKAGFACVGINGVAKFALTENNRNIAHEWNKIQINNHWYFVDTTWDDKTDSKNKYISYNYFLLNDDFGNIDHKQSEVFSLDFPVCDDQTLFHIEVPVYGFRNYDEKLIDEFLNDCFTKQYKNISLRFLNKDDYKKAIDYLLSKNFELQLSDECHNVYIDNE